MNIMVALSYKIQSLHAKSTHTSQNLTLLASIYYSKNISGIKYNYYILNRVIKVHVKQIEQRIVRRKNDKQNLLTGRSLKTEWIHS